MFAFAQIHILYIAISETIINNEYMHLVVVCSTI